MLRIGACLLAALAATGCSSGSEPPVTALVEQVPEPEANPSTPEKVELGRLLFWDPILSGERDVACATCHHPDFAYADGRELSLGVGSVGLGPDRVNLSDGRIGVVRRNAPTILNVAFNGLTHPNGEVDASTAPMFHDMRNESLEGQILETLTSREEMRGDAYEAEETHDVLVERLAAIPEYVSLFEGVFGSGPITAQNMARAIASFQRSLVTRNAPFDRFMNGDQTALSESARRGFDVFEAGKCRVCHFGPTFSEWALRITGVPPNPLVSPPDDGAGDFRFRSTSLRNVGLTAPYMHNGSLATLEDVVEHYDQGRSQDPNVPRVEFERLGLSDQSKADLVEFLHALTDEDFDRTTPDRVPSGLPVGGEIDD